MATDSIDETLYASLVSVLLAETFRMADRLDVVHDDDVLDKVAIAAFMKLKDHIKALDDGGDNPLLEHAGTFANHYCDGGDTDGAAAICADKAVEGLENGDPGNALTWADIDAAVESFRTYVPTGKVETVVYNFSKSQLSAIDGRH